MGDRGNIAVLQSDNNQIWFYGHWSGYRLEETVREALALNAWWTDESYLARIIFCRFCRTEQWAETTSFGISCTIQDNEYAIIVVDIPKQRVFFINEDELAAGKVPTGWEPDKSWTFTEFVALKLAPEPDPREAA